MSDTIGYGRDLARRLADLSREIGEGVEAEVVRLRANVILELRGPDGALKDRREVHNVICTAGKNKVLTSGVNAKKVDDYSYICIGTDSTAAAAGNTALGTEVARAVGTLSNPSAGTWQNTYTFPAGTGTGTITESALDYQVGASGAILARQVFGGIAKGASDTLAVTWQIT